MANFNSDIATQQSSGRGDTRIDGSLITGRQRILRATYTVDGTEAASDTITIGKLPAGAKIIGGRVWNEACGGTGFTVAKIGTAASDGCVSATATGITAAATTAITQVAGLPAGAFDGATDLIATLGATRGSMTAGKKVVFDIAYFV